MLEYCLPLNSNREDRPVRPRPIESVDRVGIPHLQVRSARIVCGVSPLLSGALLFLVLNLASLLAHVVTDKRSLAWWRL